MAAPDTVVHLEPLIVIAIWRSPRGCAVRATLGMSAKWTLGVQGRVP